VESEQAAAPIGDLFRSSFIYSGTLCTSEGREKKIVGDSSTISLSKGEKVDLEFIFNCSISNK
jgi:hypothetical protein